MQSPNWIPFYDDGRVVMFGRADAAEPDLTAFKNNRLEPELRAFKVSEPIPSADRPPTPTSWIDDIFQNRLLGRPQSHTNAAGRWLQGASLDADQPAIPDPARCLLAIREARTALAKSPDDWVAYRLLNAAYRLLTLQETALLAGIPLTPENQARIGRLAPEHRGPQHPVPPAGHGPQLRDPDHPPSQDPRGAARAPVAEPRPVPALPPGRLSSTWPATGSSSPSSRATPATSLPSRRPSSSSSSTSSTRP